MSDTRNISELAEHHIDEAIEAVRWCRQHLQDRGASLKLREVQLSLAAVALALQLEMDGDSARALDAMMHAEWSPEPEDPHGAYFH
jgi:hypothetical protein